MAGSANQSAEAARSHSPRESSGASMLIRAHLHIKRTQAIACGLLLIRAHLHIKRTQTIACGLLLSRSRLFVTPQAVRRPPGSSVPGILQQEYWSGLPCPPPGDLPDPGTEPGSLASLTLAGRFTTEPPGNHAYIKTIF